MPQWVEGMRQPFTAAAFLFRGGGPPGTAGAAARDGWMGSCVAAPEGRRRKRRLLPGSQRELPPLIPGFLGGVLDPAQRRPGRKKLDRGILVDLIGEVQGLASFFSDKTQIPVAVYVGL